EKVMARLRPHDQERRGGKQGEEGGEHIEPGCQPVTRQKGQQGRGHGWDEEDQADSVEAQGGHSRSPRKSWSAWRSTVSKRSRMRNRKMPMTMKAIRIEKATLISTTSGMPLAPVAAMIRPFSMDMKPMIWLTALRRVTIMSMPSSTTESAKVRSSR